MSYLVVWLMEPLLASRASANSPAERSGGSEIINAPNTRPHIRESPNCPKRSPNSSTYRFRSSSNTTPLRLSNTTRILSWFVSFND